MSVMGGKRSSAGGAIATLKAYQAREVEAWLSELDEWEDGEPPMPPTGLSG